LTLLQQYARAAKKTGQTFTSANFIVDFAEPVGLRQAIEELSFKIVGVTSERPATLVMPSDIVTWRTFQVFETVSDAETSGRLCEGERPILNARQNQIAVPLYGGSIRIDGVEVEIVESYRQFRPVASALYLMVGVRCGGTPIFVLPHGAQADVFEIRNGIIQPSRADTRLSRDLQTVRSLSALRDMTSTRLPLASSPSLQREQ
jgi:hypothetical protein